MRCGLLVMATDFEPNLSILPAPQRRLWPQLRGIPASFVLIGGTAIAVQLGHRSSVDFDFVSIEEFDPDVLLLELPLLRDCKTLQKAASTLTCLVEREAPIQISFFATPSIHLIAAPLVSAATGVRIASLLDLAGMKAAVVQKRAEAKDYLDLDAIIHRGGIDLPTALAAARSLYGRAFRPELTLKSLCYFGDGNLDLLPQATKDRLAAAVQTTDLNQLPTVDRR